MKKRIVAMLLAGIMALQGSVCYAAEGNEFSDGAEYATAASTAETGQETVEEENAGETANPVTEEFTAGIETETPEMDETENTESDTSAESENIESDVSDGAGILETEEMETSETGETEISESYTPAELEISETEETDDSGQSAEVDTEITEDSVEKPEDEIASSFEIDGAEGDLFSAGSSEASGTCGTNLTWTLADGVLTISGTGDMDHMDSDSPWQDYSSEIKKVVIGEGVTRIGAAAFYSCLSLEEVSLPSTLKIIGSGAFANCSSLKTLDLNEGLENLGEYVFENSGITALTLPSTLSLIRDLTFYMAYNLSSIEVAKGNSGFASESGVLFNADKSTLLVFPAGKTEDYQISSGVTTVNAYAFSYAKLKNVTIADTVTTLGEGAFYNSSIESLVIPDSVTKVEDFFCKACTSLVSVSIGSGLTSLSYRAFSDCSSLKMISFGTNLTDLGRYTFTCCTSLESIRIPDGVTSILNGCVAGCTSLKEVILPAGLKTIAFQAFMDCKNLSQITLPDGIENVYRYAFFGSAITEVYLPASVKVVGDHAFPDGANLIFAEVLEKQEDGSYLKTLKVSVSVKYDYKSAFTVLEIVNQRRAENGLSALSMDADLLNAAMTRAAELSIYFSHTRPTGWDCFTVNSKAEGENIAVGQSNASSVMETWMDSSGHKANILESSFTGIGVGAVKIDGVCYWVQIFTSQTPNVASASSYKNRTSVTDVVFTENDEEFKFSPSVSKLKLKAGKKKTVGMGVYNTFCTTKISADQLTFSSKDSTVCEVTAKGKLTAVSAGSTQIQIAMKKYPQIAVSISVTVYGSALFLNANSLKMQKGQASSALKVIKMAKGDYVKNVRSSNPEIVKVTGFKKTGRISLKAQNKTGSAKLTITLASGLKKKITVKVQKKRIKTKKLTVSSETITLKKGKSRSLKVSVSPITSQQKVTYKSSNKKVATVSAKGKITAKKAGTAKITIKSGSKKVIVTVKVKK